MPGIRVGRSWRTSSCRREWTRCSVRASLDGRRVPPAAIRGSWLGQVDVARTGFTLSTGTLEDKIDVAIYLSPQPLAVVPPEIDWSSPYGLELRRRQALTTLPFRTGVVRFESGTVATTGDSAPALASIVAELKRDASLHVTVKAFADGTEPDGEALSR